MNEVFTCAIAEDEPLARKLLKNFLQSHKDINLIGELKDGHEATNFIQKHQPDIVFLDIQMPKLTGIELIKKIEHSPAVIITTAYEDYAVKAYELDVVDYIVKPFSRERFNKALQKAREYNSYLKSQKPSKDFIFIKADYKVKKLLLDDILYVEAQKEYIRIFYSNEMPDLIYMRMKDLEKELGGGFFRIHKSYIVNLSRINEVKGELAVVGEKALKISRNYKAELMQKLKSK